MKRAIELQKTNFEALSCNVLHKSLFSSLFPYTFIVIAPPLRLISEVLRLNSTKKSI